MSFRRQSSKKQPPPARKRARSTGDSDAAASSFSGAEGEVLQVFVLDMEEQADTGTIALYGCSPDRRSVVLTVEGFAYYFTISAGNGTITDVGLRSDVEHHVRDRLPAAMKGFEVEPIVRRSLVGFEQEEAVPMLRIYPPAVRGATSRITQALQAELGAGGGGGGGVRVYETQIDTCTRFSLDSGIRCGNWLEITLPPGGSGCMGGKRAEEVIVIEDEEEGAEHKEGAAQGSRPGRSSKGRHQSHQQAPKQQQQKQQPSHCDVELVGNWDAAAGHVTTCGDVPVQVHAFSKKGSHWGSLPPLRTLCLSVDRYPTSVPAREWADTGDCPDPIRAVSVVTTIENGSPASQHSKRRLVLLNAAGLPAHVRAGAAGRGPFVTRVYGSEKELLEAFQALVLAEDPSLLTGFEVGEALRVLLARAEALKVGGFGEFARRRGVKVAVKTMQMYSARWAKTKTRMSGTSNQEGTEVICPGRVVLDLMRVTQMQDALRLYSLGEISISVLGKTFETLDTGQTEALLRGYGDAGGGGHTDDAGDGGARVAVGRALRAFLSTADLALEVLAKRNAVAELVEVSRVTGQQLRDVYIRGQMSRVSSLLQIHCYALGVVIPASTDDLLDKQALNRAAFLLDPSPPSTENPEAIGTAGLRRSFTAVLDFKSLYPSIMIEHNLSYDTLIKDAGGAAATAATASAAAAGATGGGGRDIFETPIGVRFVGKATREGVLPRLLADLLEARSQAQHELRQQTNHLSEGQRRVLDARQKAFKLASNAVYGFTGATVNSLYSRELGDSILSLGRDYLTRLIRTVGDAFPELKVIYADTDSVFVEYPEGGAWSREAVMQHSVETLTPALNARLPARVRLKHEKVLGPILLQHIRRYAAYEWRPDGSRRLEVKGMEMVQRNTMPFLVRFMESTLLKLLDTPPHATGGPNAWSAVRAHVQEQVAALMSNKIDIFGLTLTRGLWRLGAYDSAQPHLHLVEKVEGADPRRRFRVGERVAYVLVQREADAPLYKKAEEPWAALRQQLQLDLLEYLKQVRMPMVRMLQLVMPEAEAAALFQVQFRALQVGAKTSSPDAITHFFRASQAAQCLRCRATVEPPPHRGRGGGGGTRSSGSRSNPPLCDKCRAAPEFSILSLQQAEREAAEALTRAQAQCMACQRGGRYLPVICTNASCPVNYKRIKASSVKAEAGRKMAELEEALLG